MSLLHRRCVQLELRGVCGSTSCSATTHFRCGLVQVEPRLDLPCLTSSHTLTKSLSAARSSQLRRVLRSTGCWRGGRGCWASPVACEFKMRLKHMVLLLSGFAAHLRAPLPAPIWDFHPSWVFSSQSRFSNSWSLGHSRATGRRWWQSLQQVVATLMVRTGRENIERAHGPLRTLICW